MQCIMGKLLWVYLKVNNKRKEFIGFCKVSNIECESEVLVVGWMAFWTTNSCAKTIHTKIVAPL